MRYIISFFLYLLFLSCDSKDKNKITDLQIKDSIIKYDTIKFNRSLLPDTSGCSWITEKRVALDTLKFEKAIVLATSDTFLATTKYKRLFYCTLASHFMVPNDTVLISGFVYEYFHMKVAGDIQQ